MQLVCKFNCDHMVFTLKTLKSFGQTVFFIWFRLGQVMRRDATGSSLVTILDISTVSLLAFSLFSFLIEMEIKTCQFYS